MGGRHGAGGAGGGSEAPTAGSHVMSSGSETLVPEPRLRSFRHVTPSGPCRASITTVVALDPGIAVPDSGSQGAAAARFWQGRS